MTPEEAVSRQLECYNAHDLDGFCACYSEDVVLQNLHEPEPYARSKPELRELYRQRFSNPSLKASIAKRIAQGKYVIDQEEVEGLGEKILHVVAIYEVADGLIKSVRFIR
jgi:hypothetical protein